MWASACNINVNIGSGASNAVIVMSGGRVLNAGQIGGSLGYGIAYNGAGRLQATGVSIDGNKGGGLFFAVAPKASPVIFTGCNFL